jgi:soluble P-type ATPase
VEIEIPGRGLFQLNHLVLDFTGTLSVDGALITGVSERINELSENMDIYVLTADTFGRAEKELVGLPVKVQILKGPGEDKTKEAFVVSLGADQTAAMGNGANDALMLKRAGLGVAILEGEGCSTQAIMNSDITVKSIEAGLDLLLKPLRIKAGLRR